MMTLHDLIHKATILDNMFSCEDVPIKWCGVEIRDLLFELINGDKPEEAAINIRALIKPEEGSGADKVTFFELNGERYVIEK